MNPVKGDDDDVAETEQEAEKNRRLELDGKGSDEPIRTTPRRISWAKADRVKFIERRQPKDPPPVTPPSLHTSMWRTGLMLPVNRPY